jgi:acetolactate synthase-1/3 small subunit
MKKRWLSLFVENEIGVLARISGLFSAKSYNLDSLTVGTTEDESVSRMTISLTSDDKTFEQVKKQLNRCVEVIKVIDLTDKTVHNKELVFIKIRNCIEIEINELFKLAQVFSLSVANYNFSSVILECVQSEDKNNSIIKLLNEKFSGRIEIVRGGSVAIDSISDFND